MLQCWWYCGKSLVHAYDIVSFAPSAKGLQKLLAISYALIVSVLWGAMCSVRRPSDNGRHHWIESYSITIF